jgi:hypothetical protein
LKKKNQWNRRELLDWEHRRNTNPSRRTLAPARTTKSSFLYLRTLRLSKESKIGTSRLRMASTTA